MKILLSSYACGPNRGSEPGVGWNVANALADHCEVHVLTQSECKAEIEALRSCEHLHPHLHFHFYEIPFGRFVWKRPTEWKVRLHYQLWQRLAAREVRRLHNAEHFDAAQHVTFVRYWGRSCLADSGIPYLFGPVGGAESSPPALRGCLPWKGRLFESVRCLIRWLSERTPGTRRTIRNAAAILATTPVSAERCVAVRGSSVGVSVFGESALSEEEITQLSTERESREGVRFLCLGRQVAWKGQALAVKAFAAAAIPKSVLEFVGDGPEHNRLASLSDELGIADRVVFFGSLPRDRALARLKSADVLVHPSMHDSGGWACLEGMAAGLPVVCLDWGGPATQVSDETGIRIPIEDEPSVVERMAAAFRRLSDPVFRKKMGEAARTRVATQFTWQNKANRYLSILTEIAGKPLLQHKSFQHITSA